MAPPGKYLLLVFGLIAVTDQLSWTQKQGTETKSAAGEKKPAPKDESKSPPSQKKPVQLDSHGDPLPPEVLSRIGTVRMRHEHWVLSVGFSPDGKSIASGGYDSNVLLWDAATGKQLRAFGQSTIRTDVNAPARWVHCVAFSPDGKRLAAGLGDNTIHIWEVVSGKELLKLQGHEGAVHCLSFNGDGKTLISASADHSLRFWDATAGKETRQLAAHAPVRSLVLSLDGKTLASGGEDGFVRVWQLATGHELRMIDGHKGSVHAVALLRDVSRVISAGQDRVIRVWELAPGGNPQFAPYLWSAIPSGPGLSLIPVLQAAEFLRLNRELATWKAHQADVTCLALSPDGKTLASGSLDQTVCLWDADSGKVIRRVGQHLAPVNALAFSPDGQKLATGDRHSSIRLWNVATGEELSVTGGHQAPVEYLALLPDGQTLLTAGSDRTVRFWELLSGKELRQFLGLQQSPSAVALSADRKTVATGCRDGTIRLFDLDSGKELRRFVGHQGPINCLTFAPHDGTLVSGGEDQTIRMWEIPSCKELGQLKGHGRGVAFLAFSPDGLILASGSANETIFLWDISKRREIRRLVEHGSPVECIAFSPDGQTLAAGSRDGIVRLWEQATGTFKRQLEGHSGPVKSVVFSADGRTLAVGIWQTIRLWELASVKERARYENRLGDVISLLFSPDGKLLVSGGSDTTALVWDVTDRLVDGQLRVSKLSSAELDSLWADLASENGEKAYRSIWTFTAAAEQSVPFLQARLRPTIGLDPQQQKRIAQLIAELDSEVFAIRDKASRELESLGEATKPEFRRALNEQPTDEVRRRLEELVEKLQTPARIQERLRGVRAIEVLENIGTPEARQVLKILAQGAQDAELTREAKATLERLARRSP